MLLPPLQPNPVPKEIGDLEGLSWQSGVEGEAPRGMLRALSSGPPSPLADASFLQVLVRSAERTCKDLAAPGLAPSTKFIHPSVL